MGTRVSSSPVIRLGVSSRLLPNPSLTRCTRPDPRNITSVVTDGYEPHSLISISPHYMSTGVSPVSGNGRRVTWGKDTFTHSLCRPDGSEVSVKIHVVWSSMGCMLRDSYNSPDPDTDYSTDLSSCIPGLLMLVWSNSHLNIVTGRLRSSFMSFSRTFRSVPFGVQGPTDSLFSTDPPFTTTTTPCRTVTALFIIDWWRSSF